jgi:signal transduction histidine kinase
MFYISLAENYQAGLIWWKIAYLGVANLPVLILHTTILMVENKNRKVFYGLMLSYVITGGFYLLNLYDMLIPNVTFIFGEIYFNTPYSVWFALFFLFFNVIFGVVFSLLSRAYQDPLRFDKDLIAYVIIGLLIGYLGYGSLIFPAFNIDLYPYGTVLIAIYPLIIGFAILNHHLFNAKYGFLQLIKVACVGTISIAAVWAIIWMLSYFFSYAYDLDFIEILISVAFVWIFLALYRNRFISEIFQLESLKDIKKETQSFLERSSVFTDYEWLMQTLEEYFSKGLRIKKIELIQNEWKSSYPHTFEYFKKNSYPLIRGNISKNPSRITPNQRNNLAEEVDRMGNIIFPIENMKSTKITLLILWNKESEKPFSGEEILYIQSILPKVALALQVLEFNKALQNEVKLQTKTLAKQNKELETAYQQLQKIDKNKDNFLAIASHELRTPMTIIKWYSDLFLKNTLWPLTEAQRNYLLKIYDNTESLIGMVNNILDISKIEAGRMDIHLTDVDVHETMKSTMERFESLCQEKNIRLVFTDTASINTIQTDKDKACLIMNNLLSNAYKFTEPGWTITINLQNSWSDLHILVSDTGRGIPEAQLSQIFEKFSESNNDNYTNKSIRGTGLGLNLSKQLIEMLWGTIKVSSKVWSGSCFEIILPF